MTDKKLDEIAQEIDTVQDMFAAFGCMTCACMLLLWLTVVAVVLLTGRV